MKNETFTITEPYKRLDTAVQHFLPEYSRSKIQAMTVLLNDAPAKWSSPVKPGDNISITIPTLSSRANEVRPGTSSSGKELDILFEDDHIIAAVKPRGIATHPGAGGEVETFVHMLLSHTELSTMGGALRPGIVHRLDKDTSGILVAAKTDAAYARLAELFSKHEIKRIYTAFVWGAPGWERAEISGNIQRSKHNRQKMAMVKIGGKPATTIAELETVWGRAGISRIAAELRTGRTHQIRVHLSSHGFPLVGDKTYGRTSHRIQSIHPGELLTFLGDWNGGQMLHAGTLEFLHPITGAPLKLHSPLPSDLETFEDLLNEYTP